MGAVMTELVVEAIVTDDTGAAGETTADDDDAI